MNLDNKVRNINEVYGVLKKLLLQVARLQLDINTQTPVTSGGGIGNIQLNNGTGGFEGSNNLSFDSLAGLISVPGFTASDGEGNYANMSIYDDGEGNVFLSIGGAGTVPIRINLTNGGGFDFNGIFLNVNISTLLEDSTLTIPKGGTLALREDIQQGIYTTTATTQSAFIVTLDATMDSDEYTVIITPENENSAVGYFIDTYTEDGFTINTLEPLTGSVIFRWTAIL